MILSKCRLCNSKKLFKFLDLGLHPPSDQFKKKTEWIFRAFWKLKSDELYQKWFLNSISVFQTLRKLLKSTFYSGKLTHFGSKFWFSKGLRGFSDLDSPGSCSTPSPVVTSFDRTADYSGSSEHGIPVIRRLGIELRGDGEQLPPRHRGACGGLRLVAPGHCILHLWVNLVCF